MKLPVCLCCSPCRFYHFTTWAKWVPWWQELAPGPCTAWAPGSWLRWFEAQPPSTCLTYLLHSNRASSGRWLIIDSRFSLPKSTITRTVEHELNQDMSFTSVVNGSTAFSWTPSVFWRLSLAYFIVVLILSCFSFILLREILHRIERRANPVNLSISSEMPCIFMFLFLDCFIWRFFFISQRYTRSFL